MSQHVLIFSEVRPCKLCADPVFNPLHGNYYKRYFCLSHGGEEQRIANARKYANNREKYLQQSKEYRKAHPNFNLLQREYATRFKSRHGSEYVNASRRASYAKHRDETLERRRKVHSARIKEHKLLRKRRLFYAPGNTTAANLLLKLEYYGFQCRYCRSELTDSNRSWDHAIPLSRGGSNWTSNMIPCCRRCNSTKNVKTFFEFTSRRSA